MTPEEASEVIGPRYAAHRAACELVSVALDECAMPDDRRRALRALEALDRRRPRLDVRGPVDELGHAVGQVLIDGIVRNSDEAERRRLANLFAAVLREAERLARRAA